VIGLLASPDNTVSCHLCGHRDTFAAGGFDFLRRGGELVPACGKCSRNEVAIGPLPARLRVHERRSNQTK
jgi:hypothetical protein